VQGVIARFAAQSYEKGGICGGRVVAMFLGIDPRELSQGGPMDDSPYVSVPPTPLIREASVGNDELRGILIPHRRCQDYFVPNSLRASRPHPTR